MTRIQSSPQLKRIKIIRKLLTLASCLYIEDSNNNLSYMGQILIQLNKDIKLKVKGQPVRLVSDLNIPIPYFTRNVKNRIVQTDLASDIITLKPSPESERRLVQLLKGICEVEFE